MSQYNRVISIKLSKLFIGLAIATVSTSSFTAGLDRTGQDIRSFFSEGTYAEVDFVYIKTDVNGVDNNANDFGVSDDDSFVAGDETGNITSDANFITRYGVKSDINDNMVIGVYYDQPFGANVRFDGENSFVSKADNKNKIDTGIDFAENIVNPNIDNPDYDLRTSTKVESESLTTLIGLKSNGLQVYGGPVIQKFGFETHLRGNAFGAMSGYDMKMAKDTELGWVAGVAYGIPEIKLNAALTYRSEINHEAKIAESIPSMDNPIIKGRVIEKAKANTGEDILASDVKSVVEHEGVITTPPSVNLNFQTGLSAKYQLLGTLNARWVPWSKFNVTPPYYNAVTKAKSADGYHMLQYTDDQYSMDVGLAKRFTDKLAASAIVGYDSGAGEFTSSLGPVNGMISVGGGVKYNVTDEFAVTAGGKYMFLGDASGKLPTGDIVNKAADNHGFAGVVKLSYQETE